jgi:uncharacterized protein
MSDDDILGPAHPHRQSTLRHPTCLVADTCANRCRLRDGTVTVHSGPSGCARTTRKHLLAAAILRRVAVGAPDLVLAIAHARRTLEQGLPRWLRYHDLAHTEIYVAPPAALLADDLQLDPIDRALVLTAAWYHDLGFIERYDDNEDIAVAFAREVLPGFGYSAGQVEVVADAIWSTRVPQDPRSAVAEVVCDADLFVLGTDQFFERERALRTELAEAGQPRGDAVWDRDQIAFVAEHHYFTAAARNRNDAGKATNLERLRQRAAAR